MKKKLLVIGGATATGKTRTAISLAQRFNTEIISADSRQIYREMTIGTAKPSIKELNTVKHHFVNERSVNEDYTVGDFEREGLAVLHRLFQHTDVVVVVGGSGQFIQALCEGLDHFPAIDPILKQQIRDQEAEGGLVWLQDQISKVDPDYFAVVDRQNPARLRRALEVTWASGKPYSSFLGHNKEKRPFQTLQLRLEIPREELYQRIDSRVDEMVRDGLEQEAWQLMPWRERSALKTVGYEEWFFYFDGLATQRETIAKIKQHSRNYAKRQATWFRKHGNWFPVHPENSAAIDQWLNDSGL